MSVVASANRCLSEDELLGLAGGALADAPVAEAHLASCATCSALLAAVVRGAPARAWDALAGSMLGPYRIDAQIGAGGMGAVYRAWDPRLGRAIAVKVLHDDSVGEAQRLAVEARAAAGIEHRAIVGIYDVGIADGIHYVAMELIDGESLRSVLAMGGVGVARARELTIELVDGLVAAHARGVVHRDLKPENLLLTRDGLRILDFGLAKVAGATSLDETERGAVQGTAGYMAPEQMRGMRADARADLFAAGAIAYELATGQRAFPGPTAADRLSATLRDTPPLDDLGAFGQIIARCLAKEPRDRFQTAADLAWALGAATTTAPRAVEPRGVSRRAVLAAGAGVLATGALGYVLGKRPRAPASTDVRLRWLTHRTGRIYSARFTNDGSRVLYGAAWDGEPVQIYVVDLGSGETVALDVPSGDVLAVSARGEVAASLGHRFVDHQSTRGQLAIVSLAAGAVRPLAEDVQEADFGPDGSPPGYRLPTGEASKLPGGALAVVRASERGFRIEMPLGTVLVDEPGWITHARVAPDGALVGYLRHPHTNDDAGELVVVDVATKATRVVSSGWSSIAGLAWDPSGDALWFTASPSDLSNKLHRATLAGDVTRMPGPTTERLRVHDLAADRRALLTIDSWRLRAMAGERDCSMSGVSYVSDLSADGTQVVIGELGGLEAGLGSYLVPYAGGRRLRLGPGFPVGISPSGERVAANVREANRLVVYSTRSGDAQAIPTPGLVGHARWLDERTLIGKHGERLWRLAIDAAPIELARTSGRIALDPARRRCAYIDRASTLRVLDVTTGAARELSGDYARTEVCGWLAEPDAIVVRSMTTPIVLDRIDPTSGVRTRHREIQPPLVGLKAVDTFLVHADGARYAYSYGHELSQLLVRG
jgi:eukaryotic-like serine/threonine-protein kinase